MELAAFQEQSGEKAAAAHNPSIEVVCYSSVDRGWGVLA